MIIINTLHIGDGGMAVEGEEPAGLLELGPSLRIKPQGPVRYRLRAAMAGQDLVVTGSAAVKVKAECGRCLAPVASVLDSGGVCHHYAKAAGEEVDVTPDIREDVLLAVPQNFLCSEGCRGLCPSCGANLNKKKCRCKPEPFENPVWEDLDKLNL